ncbi:MAG TPA: erythrose 4-phosphate dehydrogenase [Bdellovibrionales bacterium]|nr:erythrose 4-phosphate dehydrogenase [Pseudobdellovibrionaceae bacterium]HAG90406.1 erythrose 4-phosphate dehydrogenase [Bdellovibrionales bacterium]|tara:strand:+ start:1210 stop:2130 length:921 start_codon:yes stop_codon:yes gene_type:complete
MQFKLGINTGFAVNRFSEPEDWIPIVGEELDLRYAQMTADMLNPDLPGDLRSRYVKRINQLCETHKVHINSTFTGGFTRVNHLAHPDKEVRKHWIEWFKKFADMSADIGSESMGSHFGIFTQKDDQDPELRKTRRQQNIDGWHEIAEYAKSKGLKYLTWEPMSISREQGETLEEARKLQEDVSRNAPLPIYVCLDVDHGDVMSPNPQDTDPYAWLSNFAEDSPLIHLKQSSMNKGGHWPFTKKHNEEGRIQPQKVLSTLRDSYKNPEFKDVTLLLELSFRERQPTDSTVVEVLKESVAYWRDAVPN